MAELMNQPTAAPTRKVGIIGGVGLLITAISAGIAQFCSTCGVTSDVPLSVAGMAVVTFLFGYFTRDKG